MVRHCSDALIDCFLKDVSCFIECGALFPKDNSL